MFGGMGLLQVKSTFFVFLFLGVLMASSVKAGGSVIDSSRYVILKEDTSLQYFTPTEKELEALFEKISKRVKSSKRRSYRGNRLKMKHYVLQVVPEIAKNGQRIIYVYGLCHYGKVRVDDWREEVLILADGGSCFFYVEYNLSKNGKFSLSYSCGSP